MPSLAHLSVIDARDLPLCRPFVVENAGLAAGKSSASRGRKRVKALQVAIRLIVAQAHLKAIDLLGRQRGSCCSG